MSTRPILLDYVASITGMDGVPYAVFESGLFNLNIIGIRTKDDRSNEFNDRICVCYRDEQGWVTRTFAATTDPGVYWREHPMNRSGTAIMKCGQYRGSHKLGLHRGLYTALVQTGARVSFWRDADRDEVLTMIPGETAESSGFVGLNIHRASSREGGSTTVDRWSAGCQVFGDPGEFDLFIRLCRTSADLYGSRFTYTLIDDPATRHGRG